MGEYSSGPAMLLPVATAGLVTRSHAATAGKIALHSKENKQVRLSWRPPSLILHEMLAHRVSLKAFWDLRHGGLVPCVADRTRRSRAPAATGSLATACRCGSRGGISP